MTGTLLNVRRGAARNGDRHHRRPSPPARRASATACKVGNFLPALVLAPVLVGLVSLL